MKIFNYSLSINDFIPPILRNIVIKGLKILSSSKVAVGEEKVFEDKKMSPFYHKNLKSYSQHQEDILIDLLLSLKPIGYYVDVGANDPEFNSNTQRFYERGWTGINIEPKKTSIEKFYKARKRDINLNIGIASRSEMATFYTMPDDTLCSFDKNQAQMMSRKFNYNLSIEEVRVFPLKEVLNQYVGDKNIDFMSVDTEGYDLDVLKSNDWTIFRPNLVLIEMNNAYQEIVAFLAEVNYLLIFNNEYNGIFVNLTTSDKNLRKLID